jgi:hypothetical protein
MPDSGSDDRFWSELRTKVRIAEGKILWDSEFEYLVAVRGAINLVLLARCIDQNVIAWEGVEEIDWRAVRADYEEVAARSDGTAEATGPTR